MKKFAFLGICLAVLAACGQKDGVTFDGQTYNGKAKAVRGDRAAFVSQGGSVSSSVEGAKQAAVYEAIVYCIGYLGSSDIAWEQGPDVEDGELVVEGDRVVLTGRCLEP